MIRRAIQRGELPDHADPRKILETRAAPLYFRLLIGDHPLDAPFITRCIDHTLALCPVEIASGRRQFTTTHGPGTLS
ncbi:TetR-like C-terminal domain-containing protein [Nocardia niigatensis]